MAAPKEKKNVIDDPVLIIAMFAIISLGISIFWKYSQPYISAAYVYIRYIQVWFIYAIGNYVDVPLIADVKHWVDRMCIPDGLISVCNRDWNSVTLKDLVVSSAIFNGFLIPFFLFYAYRMYNEVITTNPKVKFSKVHSFESFLKEFEPIYPHLKIFNHINLIDEDIDAIKNPIFGMALTSRQFVYKYRLINGWEEGEGGDYIPSIDRKKAENVFREQLGRPYTGINNLSPSETILFALTFPKVAATNNDISDDDFQLYLKDSDSVMDWAWQQFKPAKESESIKDKNIVKNQELSWLTPDINLEYPKSIIKKYLTDATVRKTLNKHAYSQTMLFSLFTESRRLGVLPPADLRWLRFFDRKIWYVVQNIGRKAPFPEGAAAFCHYIFECTTGEPLEEPQLNKAIDALQEEVQSFKFYKKDKDEYINSFENEIIN